MKWYYKTLGGHVHIRVYLNGALCGRLIFREEEFRKQIYPDNREIEFIADPEARV